jgi:hypothetical protein
MAIDSGMPSGPAASPTRSKSSSRSPTCSSCAGSTTCTRWRRTRPPGSSSRWSAASFPKGKDPKGRAYEDLRWSRFKNFAPAEMYDGRRRARLPVPAHAGRRRFHLRAPHEGRALHHPHARAAGQGRGPDRRVPMEDRDTKGDLYEYMLGKIASAGQNGQFRTPRHIIRLMVEMTAPSPPTSSATRPAARRLPGRGGEYLRERITRKSSATPSSRSTSTTACSTASTSTTPCCASAA